MRLICDMFTRSSHAEDKERILSQFTNPNSTLRVVVATIAFGMRIDAPNVRTLIHWGLLSQSKTMFKRVAGVDEMERTRVPFSTFHDLTSAGSIHRVTQ